MYLVVGHPWVKKSQTKQTKQNKKKKKNNNHGVKCCLSNLVSFP